MGLGVATSSYISAYAEFLCPGEDCGHKFPEYLPIFGEDMPVCPYCGEWSVLIGVLTRSAD